MQLLSVWKHYGTQPVLRFSQRAIFYHPLPFLALHLGNGERLHLLEGEWELRDQLWKPVASRSAHQTGPRLTYTFSTQG